MGTNRLNDLEVQVLVDDTWHDGWLDPDHWQQDRETGRWSAPVRWTRRTGAFPENFLWTFDQDHIRQVG